MSPNNSPLLILVALSLAGGLVAFADGWRLPLLALSAQYVLVGALLSPAVSRDLALVKIVVGGLVGAILLTTKQPGRPWARLTEGPGMALAHLLGRRGSRVPVGEMLPHNPSQPSLGRRLLGLILPASLLLTLALASIALTGLWQQRSPAPMPPATGLAAAWMMGVGLLTLASRRRPFRVGLGLLTLVTGFETAYTPLEPSLIMAGLLASLNIGIGLAIASLEIAAPPPESGL